VETYCLSCGHNWNSRTPASRQCPNCWSRAIAGHDELTLAGIIAKLLGALSIGYPLPPPSPKDRTLVPLSLVHFVTLMGRAKTQKERWHLVKLMLTHVGIADSQADAEAKAMCP